MKRRDILFFAGVVLLVTACFFLRGFLYRGNAFTVEFSQDGNVVCRLELSDREEQEIRIDSADGGYNLVRIENGSVFVAEADCENGDCIRQGRISRTGESIFCLPHKLAVTIVGGAKKTDGLGGTYGGDSTDKDDTSTEEYDAIVR